MKNIHEWLSVCIEEYKTVRTECLTAIKTQNSTLTFGAAVIGLLVNAAAIMLSKNELIAGVILWVGIPLVSLLVVLIWAGEVMRLIRAHRFVVSIEKKVNESIDEVHKVLRYGDWTDGISDKMLRPTWNYKAVIWLFYSISALSFVGGGTVISMNLFCREALYPVIPSLIGVCVIGAYITNRELKRRLDRINDFKRNEKMGENC